MIFIYLISLIFIFKINTRTMRMNNNLLYSHIHGYLFNKKSPPRTGMKMNYIKIFTQNRSYFAFESLPSVSLNTIKLINRKVIDFILRCSHKIFSIFCQKANVHIEKMCDIVAHFCFD